MACESGMSEKEAIAQIQELPVEDLELVMEKDEAIAGQALAVPEKAILKSLSKFSKAKNMFYSECIDSDGNNPNRKGSAIQIMQYGDGTQFTIDKTDYCNNNDINNNKVNEYVCNNNKLEITIVGCPLGCSKGACQQPECDISFPSDAILKPHVYLLAGTPGLLEATQLCNSTQSFQNKLWNKLRTAEMTGTSPAAGLPASVNTATEEQYFILLTREEAENIYTAHVAHSLWLDRQEILPWKLADYNKEELKTLFDPSKWFWEWAPDEGQNGKYEMGYLVDHSPAETFDVVDQSIDIGSLTDQRQAIIDIVKSLRYYRHYNGDVDYCDDLNLIDTVAHMSIEKVSRFGCQSMASYFVNLAAAINIPGSRVKGYYGGVGHMTALFEYTNQVLAHGDDVYVHVLWNTPSTELLDSYEFWEENILAYPEFNPESAAAHDSRISYYENSAEYPAKHLMNQYCNKGRVYLDEFFLDYLTSEEIDDVEARIILITNDCAVIPPNNPDGMGSADSICYASN